MISSQRADERQARGTAGPGSATGRCFAFSRDARKTRNHLKTRVDRHDTGDQFVRIDHIRERVREGTRVAYAPLGENGNACHSMSSYRYISNHASPLSNLMAAAVLTCATSTLCPTKVLISLIPYLSPRYQVSARKFNLRYDDLSLLDHGRSLEGHSPTEDSHSLWQTHRL